MLIDMNNTKQLIIGLAGIKNSGKDTAASMLYYILRNGTAGTFRDWSITCDVPNGNDNIPTVHFADYCKEVLSNLLGIDLKYFYSRKHKDELWYAFDTKVFLNDDGVRMHHYYTIESIHLTAKPLGDFMNYNNGKVCIKIRTLMKYFGTDVIRRIMGDNVWVNKTIRDANYLLNKHNVCFIPDVRFNNEAEAIRRQQGGCVIKLNRKAEVEDTHVSELININDNNIDVVVDNNDTKMVLFYNLFNALKHVSSKT